MSITSCFCQTRSHKLLSLAEGGEWKGLSEYLRSNATLEEVLHQTPLDGLTLLPAGATERNSGRLLGSAQMKVLLDNLEDRFDIMIVDCPAGLPVVDATILAPHMGGVLLVAAAEEVEIGAVRMAQYRLRHVGAPMAGAILNKVREHAAAIIIGGYRHNDGKTFEHYPPHRILKVKCKEVIPTNYPDRSRGT